MLTLTLENPEKGGRTRGLGISYPWSLGFEAYKDTYRSQARAKRRQEEQDQDKYNQLLARIEEHQRQIDDLRASRQDPSVDITAGPSQRKSSVADSEAPAPDA